VKQKEADQTLKEIQVTYESASEEKIAAEN
jgi:hypothetical protein